MRFHLPALPGRPVTRENSSCAYSNKVRRFRSMMRDRGHDVTVYGGEGADVECYPDDAALDWAGDWTRYNTAAAAAIAERAERKDFLGLIAGECQQPIATALPHLMDVEYGIGYVGTFSEHRVFESTAWRHVVFGAQAGDPMADVGQFYDAVIPNYFDLADFPLGETDTDDPFVLFVGRMIDRKGVHVAAQAAERAGVPLVLAGHETETVPDYGTFVGQVGPEERADLMGRASALLAPTLYTEPFGGVAVEAQLCGTPAITTDWGAFTETVDDGRTGYRCHTLADFAAAITECVERDEGRLSPPMTIREWAASRYSVEAVAPQYERYFERLLGLWGEGWNA